MTFRNGLKFLLITLRELLARPATPAKWLVDGLIPIGSLNVLSGDPGSYKTWILQHLILCVSRGEPLFGKFSTKKGKVLLIDEENREDLLKERFTQLGATTQDNAVLSVLANFKVDSPTDMLALKEVVEREKIDLVIFDSLVRIHNADENQARQMAAVFEPFKELMRDGVAVLFTHHHRKQALGVKYSPSQGLRGSSDISAAVDSHLGVEHDRVRKILTLTQAKSRQSEAVEPFEVAIITGNNTLSLEYAGEAEKSLLKKDEAKDFVRSSLTLGPATRSELERDSELAVGKGALALALRELVNDGEIYQHIGPHGKKTYSLTPPETPNESGSQVDGNI